ncbi:MAG: ATP-binding protein [Candidatus Zixiibacteriota bacterium]
MFTSRGSSSRPDLLARLSHLIAIQVVFVFAALALVLLYPSPYSPSVSNSSLSRAELDSVAVVIPDALEINSTDDLQLADLHAVLQRIVRTHPNLEHAELFVKGTDGQAICLSRTEAGVTGGSSDRSQAISQLIDPGLVNVFADHAMYSGYPVIAEDGRLVRHYPLGTIQGGSVLVTVSSQDLLVTPRSSLKSALLLVFLASTLVGLLIIYLLSHRFRQPLRRLIRGLEKTAEGEMYCMVETEGDGELQQLERAFNTMSRSLWNGSKQLKQFNEQLKTLSLTLFESQVFLSILIDSSPNSVIVAQMDGHMLLFNRQAREAFGYEPAEIIGTGIEQLFAGPKPQPLATQSDKPGAEVLCCRKDGSMFPAYMLAATVSNKFNEPIAKIYTLSDISESREFQEMMIRLDRYYTKGQMVGDIAHEINNFLAILSGNIELMPLFLRKGDQEKIDSKLELMKTTVDRIARFCDGLMDVDPDQAHYTPASINQTIENMVAFLKPQNRFQGVQFATRLAPDLPLAEVDIGQVQQLMVNMIHNAADAVAELEEGAAILIATSLVPNAEEPLVRIEVTDNGPGVDETRRELLFEKRFTTKRKGHGIGLITCRKIVDGHRGRIGYDDSAGTCFYAELPVQHPVEHPEHTDHTATIPAT